MIRRAAFVLLLMLSSCHPRSATPSVSRAWVRLAAVDGQPAAAYFTLHGGRHDVKLVRIESALAAKVELHQSMAGAQGMASMMPLDHVDLPARGALAFKPGSYHAMLIGLDRAAQPGTALPLRFGFSDGSTAEAEAKSVAAGEDAPY